MIPSTSHKRPSLSLSLPVPLLFPSFLPPSALSLRSPNRRGSFPSRVLFRAFNASFIQRTARDKLPAYRFQNTASYSMKEQNEQRMTDIEDIDSPGMGIRVRTTAPVCYGRNMTFPRPTSSYAHRHELPAIVTEGESCRLLAEVRDDRAYVFDSYSCYRAYFGRDINNKSLHRAKTHLDNAKTER